MYLIKSIAELGAFLDGKRLYFKSLDSDSIYIDASYCVRIKINNLTSSPKLNSCSLLSPEEMDDLEPAVHHKSRVFSLGMLISECLTLLDSVVTYYDYASREISVDALNN